MSELNVELNNRKIYYRTIMFPLVRILFYFIAIVVLFCVTAVGILISLKLYGDSHSGLTNIFAFVAIILFLYLLGFGKQEYGAAQNAVFTEALINNEVPKKEIKFGRAWVHRRFSTYAPLQLFIKCVKAVADRIRKQDPKFSFLAELRAVLLLFIVETIPFLSSWCISWAYMHPDDDMLKCCIDATEMLFRQRKKTFPLMIGSLFSDLLQVFIFTMVAGVLLYEGALNSEIVAKIVNELGKFNTKNDALEVVNNCVFIVSIIYSYIILIFINPFHTISLLRKLISITGSKETKTIAFDKYTKIKAKIKTKFKK